jgi:hypothetical protein
VQREIFEMLVGGILDAGFFLVRRVGRGNGADGP